MASGIWVKIGSGNGLLPDGTKPLPEPMWTYHQWFPLTFIWGHYRKQNLKLHFYTPVWNPFAKRTYNAMAMSVRLSPLQYHFKSLHIISRHYKKSLLRSQIYHGYEELSTDTNYPIWRRQKLPYMKKTRKKKQVCGAACFMAAEIKFSEDVRPSVRVFRTFFQRALRYQFETWYMHTVGGTTCRVWVSSQLGHFDLVYSQK